MPEWKIIILKRCQMSSERILTRRSWGLDNRVWQAMIVLVILSGGLLGYRLMDKPKCKAVDFSILNQSCTDSINCAGDMLLFSSLGTEKEVSWDFNDNTGIHEGATITHQFTQEGKYYVRMRVNSSCDTTHTIIIKKKEIIDVSVPEAKIMSNDRTFENVRESFRSSYQGDSYEWSVANHPELGISNDAIAGFKFPNKGTYTIELILNKNLQKKYTKNIVVLGPVISNTGGGGNTTVSTNKKTPISEPTFKEMVQQVVYGKVFAKDFIEYLCSEGATPVIINGKTDDRKNLLQACEYLNGKRVSATKVGLGRRAIKIDAVKLDRDDKLCIRQINITYH
jgi:hypothetical protein